ncbi:MAG: N-acetyltransferase, partial [Planctomycetota bacterium]
MSPLNRLRIETVRTARQRSDFYRVRREIYRSDPAAVIPFRKMEWSFLNPSVHPFYLHARREVFLAYEGNRPVGRIAAIVDDLHNQHYADRLGFFGFFECPPDQEVADRLLNAAADYLVSQGRDQVRGPMNPSMKGEFGVLVEGHQHAPRVMMAHTTNYYAQLLETFG